MKRESTASNLEGQQAPKHKHVGLLLSIVYVSDQRITLLPRRPCAWTMHACHSSRPCEHWPHLISPKNLQVWFGDLGTGELSPTAVTQTPKQSPPRHAMRPPPPAPQPASHPILRVSPRLASPWYRTRSRSQARSSGAPGPAQFTDSYIETAMMSSPGSLAESRAARHGIPPAVKVLFGRSSQPSLECFQNLLGYWACGPVAGAPEPARRGAPCPSRPWLQSPG